MALEEKRFNWRSEGDEELAYLASVGANAYRDGVRVTVRFHDSEKAGDYKAFLMERSNVKELEGIPKLEELHNKQVQVAFSTRSPELCKRAFKRLSEISIEEFPKEEVGNAIEALNLNTIGQAQKQGMSR